VIGKIATIAAVLGILVGTVSIVWTGLNGPPPLWIVEYGLPGAQGPTGRVARIEGIEFVEISPGYFRMGSDRMADPGDLLGRLRPSSLDMGRPPSPSNEMPVHWVRFPTGFWIARTEVTNEQYSRYRPEHEPSNYSFRPRGPAIGLSWHRARWFCHWLSEKSGVPVRLPSESEWEAACRAGSRTCYSFGDGPEALGEYAWFLGNCNPLARIVGLKKPNDWGLYDMHGNVYEWCADPWHDGYRGAPDDGSSWWGTPMLSGGMLVVVARGGDRQRPAEDLRSANRAAVVGEAGVYVGVRPAFSLAPGREHLVDPYLVAGE
jgi:formylglycine-generating enzyme required for sulfatase activity